MAIEGIQKTDFGEVLLNNRPKLDVERAERDIVEAAKQLVSKNSDIGAIVLECTNLPPFAKSIQNSTGLPVFDIVTLTNMVYASVIRQAYSGTM